MTVISARAIRVELDDIREVRKKYDYAGGAAQLVERLPLALKVFDTRTEVFDNMSRTLSGLSADAPDHEAITSLQVDVRDNEHFINVVQTDREIEPAELDASIRWVVERENLMSSPSIRAGLIHWAITYRDFGVRRLAWLHICRQLALSRPPSEAGGSGSQGQFGSDELKRLRKEFMARREVLGPRGTLLTTAKIAAGAAGIIPHLLAALANPHDVDRNELVLTLGEIGGEDVATFLADSLRIEIEERGADKNYQEYLAAALARLGGPQALDALLRVAERAEDEVRLSALSAIESLATGGAIALTEYAEPAILDSDRMRDVYVELAQRLRELLSAGQIAPYVRNKVEELLENVEASLTLSQTYA